MCSPLHNPNIYDVYDMRESLYNVVILPSSHGTTLPLSLQAGHGPNQELSHLLLLLRPIVKIPAFTVFAKI